MTTTPDEFSLDAKYTLERGRVYLSGIQALVRLPFDQHRADRARGLNTATFISGYRGSPLGGLDQTLERNPELLAEHNVVFSSGLNEDLAATAVFGSQMVSLFPRPKIRRRARHVVRQGAGRGSQRRRIQARQLRGHREERRRPRPRRRRSRLEVLDAAEPLRGRPLGRPDPDDLPGQRAGDPGHGPARLHALAHLRALGGDEDRHQCRRRGGHGRGGSGSRAARDSRPSSWTASRTSTPSTST